MTTNKASEPRTAIKSDLGDEISLPSGDVLPTKGSPAIASEDRVDVIAERINSNWQKSLEGIRHIASACAEAKDFSPAEKQRLLKRLPFSEPMFSKLSLIGADDRLIGDKHVKALPPSISTLYELHRLRDDEFDHAISNGVISATLTRQQLQRWTKDGLHPAARNSSPSIKSGQLYCLYSDTPLSADQRDKLDGNMAALADDLRLKAKTFTGERLLIEVKKFLSSE